MRYEKQNFVEGQILTAEMLNHMEEGIRDLAEESGQDQKARTPLLPVFQRGDDGQQHDRQRHH